MPERIQRKRTKDWQMPKGAVYVGRPTKWGNPWKIGDFGMSREDVVREHRLWLVRTLAFDHPFRRQFIGELRGKDLVCWCPTDLPCHADTLLEFANAQEGSG